MKVYFQKRDKTGQKQQNWNRFTVTMKIKKNEAYQKRKKNQNKPYTDTHITKYSTGNAHPSMKIFF